MQRLCQTCFSCGRIIQLSDDILKKDNCTVYMGHSQLKGKKNLNHKKSGEFAYFSPLCFIPWGVAECVFFLFIPVDLSTV